MHRLTNMVHLPYEGIRFISFRGGAHPMTSLAHHLSLYPNLEAGIKRGVVLIPSFPLASLSGEG